MDRINDYLISGKGALLLIILAMGDLAVLVWTFVGTSIVLGGHGQTHGFHIMLSVAMLVIAKATKDDGEMWKNTSKYTYGFWGNSVAISVVIGVALYTFLSLNQPNPFWEKILFSAIYGVYTLFPLTAACKALIIAYHRT